MRRILITGATGYIGSFLAKELQKNETVLALARQPLNKTYVEIYGKKLEFAYYDGTYESIFQTLQRFRPDVVYHLATHYTGKHDTESVMKLYQSNIFFGGQLLEAMAQSGYRKIVYISSVMCYCSGEGYSPANLYAATKQALYDILRYYTDAGLIQAVSLILADTYGPGDRRPKILNLVKECIQKNKSITLSPGTQDYDVVYIDDVIQAFIVAMDLFNDPDLKDQTYQIAASEVLSLRETVELFLKVNGLALNAEWGKRPSSPREIQKAVRLFPMVPGWSPKVSLEEGLKRFWKL